MKIWLIIQKILVTLASLLGLRDLLSTNVNRLSEIEAHLQRLTTQVNRIERKVYRDIQKEEEEEFQQVMPPEQPPQTPGSMITGIPFDLPDL